MRLNRYRERITLNTSIAFRVAGLITIVLTAVACGTSATEPTNGQSEYTDKLQELEKRIERLELVHPELPPSPFSQIGISRTWVPKEMDYPALTSLIFRVGVATGLREPRISNWSNYPAMIDGLDYVLWSGQVGNLGDQCEFMQLFLTQLESQMEWPTLVIDSVELGSVLFHITTRESDQPLESREEYEALTVGRGTFAYSELSCQPLK